MLSRSARTPCASAHSGRVERMLRRSVDMRCSDIMKRDVEWIRHDESVLVAARCMRDQGIGILPVCDARRRVVGVVTDRDLALRVCAEGRSAAATLVRDVMTPDVVSCRPGHPLGHAEHLMRQHRISRVFVTDRNAHVVGVVSLSDLVQYEAPARIAQTLGGIAERKFRSESP